MFRCDGCRRRGVGFLYKCSLRYCDFELDVRCASLPDPLSHGCHPHDLFFNLTKGDCMGCGYDDYISYFLECIKCITFLGITCASLPSEAHYRHDRHPLTLCYGEEDTTSGQYWCEKCESKLDATEWFYTCDSCRFTLHVNCLLGEDIYMKPRHIFKLPSGRDVEIARNDGNSRQFCFSCTLRCAQPYVLKMADGDEHFCTLTCIVRSV
ncbi:putative chromatin regulator PHD family [Arabidopsis thaliana]